MKKISLLLLLISLLALSLTACDFGAKDDPCKNGHKFGEYTSNGNATCTSDGTKTAKCERCDKTDTVVDNGSAKGHSFTNYVADGNADCKADGTKTAKCDRCNEKSTVTDAGSKLAHDMGEYKAVKNASCTEDGLERRSCANCIYYEERKIPAKSHDYNLDAWGYTGEDGHAHKCFCGACDTPIAHTPGPEATEDAPQVCIECGFVIVPEKEHVHSFDQMKVVESALKQPATCTSRAQYYYSCSCGNKDSTRYFEQGSFKEHDFADADCTHPKTCKDCGATEGGVVHTWLDATCTEAKTCKLCDKTEGEALGHLWDKDGGDGWVVTKEPTTTEKGLKERECERCEKHEQNDIPRLDDGNPDNDGPGDNMDSGGWTPI